MKYSRRFKQWINSLLDEGYDLSDCSMDEMYEIYEDNASDYERMQRNFGPEAQARARRWRSTQQRLNLGVVKGGNNSGYTLGRNAPSYADPSGPEKYLQAASLAARLNKQEGLGRFNTNGKPRQNVPTQTPGEREFRGQGGFAAQAQRAPDKSIEQSLNRVQSQRASVINVRNLAGKEQKVTAGRPYEATLNSKPATVTYDLQGKRTVTQKEEFYNWVDELFEEGYNLSNYTWEGLFEYYLNEIASKGNSYPTPTTPPNRKVDPKDVLKDVLSAVRTGNLNAGTTPTPSSTATASSSPAATSSTPAAAAKPTPPAPLTMRGGQTGTGVGDAFTPRAWTSAETSRFKAQGLKTYDAQRSAALKQFTAARSAAQTEMNKARDTGMSVWRAANSNLANKTPTANPLMDRTFGYQTGQSPSDIRTNQALKGPARDVRALATANVGNLPNTPTPTPTTMTTPRRPLSAADQRSGMREQKTYDFARPNQVARDMKSLYQSIYEGKKIDQDMDGDNDGADVMIARMVASGMSREEAIRRTRKKSYNKESYDLDQLAILYLMQEGYAKDLRAAQAIYENASVEFKQDLQEIAPAVLAVAARALPAAGRFLASPTGQSAMKLGGRALRSRTGRNAISSGLNWAAGKVSNSGGEEEEDTSSNNSQPEESSRNRAVGILSGIARAATAH